jgi:hypothetical protein
VPHAFFGVVVVFESEELEDSDFDAFGFFELPPVDDEPEV